MGAFVFLEMDLVFMFSSELLFHFQYLMRGKESTWGNSGGRKEWREKGKEGNIPSRNNQHMILRLDSRIGLALVREVLL